MNSAHVAGLALWGATAVNYVLFRDPLYPAFIQSALWAIVMTLFAAFSDLFAPVSPFTTILIVGCSMTFSAGTYVASRGHKPWKLPGELEAAELPSNFACAISLGLSAAFLPVMASTAFSLMQGGPFESDFTNLRYSLTSEGETYGRLMYAVWLSYFTAAIFALKALNDRTSTVWRWLAALAFAGALAYAVLVTGRGFVVFLILLVGGVVLLQRRTSVRTATLVGLVIAVVLFAVYGIVLGKGGRMGAGLGENLVTLSESMLVYLVGGVPALDQVIARDPSLEWGTNTFTGIASTLNTLGLEFESRPLTQPFTNVPYPINIYTAYQPYYLDFGVVGPPILMFAMGVLHGLIYRRATARAASPAWRLAYGVSLFPLSMQYATEFYFAYFKQWIVFALIIVVGAGLLKADRLARVRSG